jgi:HTH-type transcriptional regulator/antitoxin HigA
VDVRSISSEREYRQALKEIESLIRSKAGTPEGERLNVLVSLVERWEGIQVTGEFAGSH